METPEQRGTGGRRRLATFSTAGRVVATKLPLLLWIVVGSAVLSVNTFPVIGNDSVLYLEHSRAISEGGWVEVGYRQVGYPFALAIVRTVAGFLGAEPLLSVAVVQRALLILGAYLAWRFWRWWSIPVIVFCLAAETLAYTNYLLTESLAIPLALLLVFPTVRFLELLREEATDESRRRAIWLAVVIVILVTCLYSMRFTYAVFGAVPLVVAVAGWRSPFRATTAAMLGTTVLIFGSLALLMSIENREEEGVFAPNVSGQQVRYYYAWQQVFTVHLENRDDPALAEYYDDGTVHDFPREAAARDLSPDELDALYDAEIERMLTDAGIDPLWSRVESSFFALAGGRLHDLGGIDGVLESHWRNLDEVMLINEFTMTRGYDAFIEEYNDGRRIDAVMTAPIGVSPPIPSTRVVVAGLLPLALVVMAFGLFRDPTRPLAVIGLLVVVVYAIGMGWIRADNLRFVLPAASFGVAMASGVLAGRIGRSLRGVNRLGHDEGRGR